MHKSLKIFFFKMSLGKYKVLQLPIKYESLEIAQFIGHF